MSWQEILRKSNGLRGPYYMNISVVRISLFVSNNYNMVVIYQPYTSIKYARYITILNTVDIDSTNPKRLRIRNPRGKLSLIYYFYTIYIKCIQTHNIGEETYIDITKNPFNPYRQITVLQDHTYKKA